LDDLVGLGFLQLVDHTIHNIAEYNLIARVVEAADISIRHQLFIRAYLTIQQRILSQCYQHRNEQPS
jgi:hypothetical protein